MLPGAHVIAHCSKTRDFIFLTYEPPAPSLGFLRTRCCVCLCADTSTTKTRCERAAVDDNIYLATNRAREGRNKLPPDNQRWTLESPRQRDNSNSLRTFEFEPSCVIILNYGKVSRSKGCFLVLMSKWWRLDELLENDENFHLLAAGDAIEIYLSAVVRIRRLYSHQSYSFLTNYKS